MQSLILLSLAASAFAAPLPGVADVDGLSKQGATAIGGLVGAAAPIAANVAADVVDVKVVDNNVANDVLNYNVVDVLHRRGVADVDALTKQGAGAVAGVAAVAAPIAANVAANVADIKVVDNNVANDVLNHNFVDVLRRGVADVDGLTKQGAAAVGGLAGVALPVAANAAADVADVTVNYNNIANNDLNNNVVGILRRSGVADVDGLTKQGAGAIGGLAGVAAPVAGNVAAVVGDVDVECNDILNNVGNGNTLDVLKRDVSSATGQGAAALGGLAAIAAPVVANVDAIVGKVKVEDNNVANDVLNNNFVHVLRRGAADVSAVTGQLAGSVGAVAASIPTTVNAAADVVDVVVANNNIGNNVLNGNTVKVLKREGVSDVDALTKQGAGAVGAVAAAIPVVANVAGTVGSVDVLYNNVANNVGNGNVVKVL